MRRGFLVLLTGLSLFSSLARSAEVCKSDSKEIENILNTTLDRYKKLKKTPDQTLPLTNILRYETLGDKVLKRRVFIEVFTNPEPSYYRVAPGLPLGLETTKSTYLYVCYDLKEDNSDNKLVIHFLKRPFLHRLYRTSPASIDAKPIHEAELLVTKLFGHDSQKSGGKIDEFDSQWLTSNDSMVNQLLSGALHVLLDVGVYRVEVSPTTIRFQTEARVMSLLPIKIANTGIDFDSSWMLTGF